MDFGFVWEMKADKYLFSFSFSWQYKDSNKYGGDSDVFNGDLASLKKLASG